MDRDSIMTRAIELSKNGLGLTFPNPIVGAVVVSASGEIIGEGFHSGGAHAETIAIEDCIRNGRPTQGSTIYVSLEPCNHIGKTPPCSKAIVEAGIARVFYAVADPNPIAQGGGQYLQQQSVEVIPHLLEAEAAFSNRAWLHKIANKRPYFNWKIASTFDGYSAAEDGTSKWITSDASRNSVQNLRAEADAILVGTGTALADNPSLIPSGDHRRPLRIVMGQRALPPTSNLLNSESKTILFSSRDIDVFINDVNALGINSILVEAGARLGTALLKAGCIDEITWFQAPTLFGAGQKVVGDLDVTTLSQRLDFTIAEVKRVGGDICTVLLPKKKAEASF